MFFYLVFAASLMLTRPLVLLVVCFLTLIGIGSFLGPFHNAIITTYTSPIQLEFVIGAVLGHGWVSRRLRMPLGVGIVLVSVGAVMLLLRYEAHRLAYLIQMAGAAMVVAGSLQERFLRWNNRTLQALGDASYSNYLTHLIALGGLRWAWGKFGPPLTPALSLVFLVIGVVLSCAVGWLVYRRIEQPMTRWLNAKLARGQRPVLAAA
jgi:exopolysaccharide production protein ExoZ